MTLPHEINVSDDNNILLQNDLFLFRNEWKERVLRRFHTVHKRCLAATVLKVLKLGLYSQSFVGGFDHWQQPQKSLL